MCASPRSILREREIISKGRWRLLEFYFIHTTQVLFVCVFVCFYMKEDTKRRANSECTLASLALHVWRT